MPHLSPPQRLIVCLDGTWNVRDDTTNVFHHLALTYEGEVQGPRGRTIAQRRFYHRGVGTGVLDRVSGGGFGFGIEENVRAAYNWLVENFQEGPPDAGPDEIYLFGFSRGAYTARSLVGFISRCGLLRRGAPLTVKQLWEDYCVLGREHEQRRSAWDRLFGETPTRIRPINALIADPWDIAPDAPPAFPGALPGQRRPDLTASEQLLIRWSRRVRITYLGIYDTVGAIGFDALAIPGLKSKLALHHNMRPTTLVQSCRHALALDEHRSSFAHTPLVEYIGHSGTAAKWMQNHAMWRRKIEQRWFVGAHANIGGGYPDNALGQAPLRWVFEGAGLQGLVQEPMPPASAAPGARPRDSHAEFLAPVAAHVLRAKRHYRRLDPPATAHAGRRQRETKIDAGYSLARINEQVDDTVFDFVARTGAAPPNLVDYARRRTTGPAPGPFPPNTAPNPARLATVLAHAPRHVWLGTGVGAHIWLALWTTLVAAGFTAACRIVFAAPGFVPPPLFLAQLATVFVLIDLLESRLNFSLALGSGGPAVRAFRDTLYWLRALGVVLFAIGAVAGAFHLVALGWDARSFLRAGEMTGRIAEAWWLAPFAAGAAIAVGRLLDGFSVRGFAMAMLAAIAAPALAAALSGGLILASALLARIAGGLFAPPIVAPGDPPAHAALAGVLLLLQAAAFYFFDAWTWVTGPMNKANLGSVVRLQRCWTPRGVKTQLDRWTRMLTCEWVPPDPSAAAHGAAAMRAAVRETLWRDIVGFIPLYGLILSFGGWFAAWLAAERWGIDWLQQAWCGVPRWLWPALIAALADWAEDFCQLHFLQRHERGTDAPAWLTVFSGAFTSIKLAAFTLGSVLTAGALIHGSWVVARVGPTAGWRGTVATLISSAAAAALVAIGCAALIYRIRMHLRVRRGDAHLDRENVG